MWKTLGCGCHKAVKKHSPSVTEKSLWSSPWDVIHHQAQSMPKACWVHWVGSTRGTKRFAIQLEATLSFPLPQQPLLLISLLKQGSIIAKTICLPKGLLVKCIQLNMLDHAMAKLAIPKKTNVYRYMQLAGPGMKHARMSMHLMFIKYVFPKHRFDDVSHHQRGFRKSESLCYPLPTGIPYRELAWELKHRLSYAQGEEAAPVKQICSRKRMWIQDFLTLSFHLPPVSCHSPKQWVLPQSWICRAHAHPTEMAGTGHLKPPSNSLFPTN